VRLNERQPTAQSAQVPGRSESLAGPGARSPRLRNARVTVEEEPPSGDQGERYAQAMSIEFEFFGELKEQPCSCGCGQVHRRAKGAAKRVPEGGEILFFCLLARHHAERHAWLAIGTGP